jgi:hypothetical protein
MKGAWLISILVWPAVAAAQIPVLQVSPARLAFTSSGTVPAPAQQVRVRNIGSGTLRWSARASEAWIRVSPGSGDGPAVLSIDVDATRLAPGRHEGRVTVDAPDADDSPFSIAISVDVTVSPAAARAASPGPAPPAQTPAGPPASTSAASPAAGGRAPSASQTTTEAPGRLRIDRTVLPPATRNLPYAQAIPVAGGTPPYTLRVVEGRLPAGLVLANGAISGTARVQGYYPFVVLLTDAASPPARLTQTLGLRVIILQPDTALVVSPPAISMRLSGRSRDARAALAIGSGRQRLEWSAAADVAWLQLTPAAGLSPSEVAITVAAGRLPPGTHVGTITVTMEGAPNSPASIPVQVTVPR